MRDLETRYSATSNGAPPSRLGVSAHGGGRSSLGASNDRTKLHNTAHGRLSGTNAAAAAKIRVNRPSINRQGSARPGMVRQASARPGLQTRAASARPTMTKKASVRPSMAKQTSTPVMAKQKSKKELKKEKSKKKLEKEKSKKALKKEKSKKKLEKEKSKKELKKEKSKKQVDKEPSRGNLQRTASRGNLQRTPSRGNLQRTPSRGNLQRTASRGPGLERTLSPRNLQRTPSRSDLRRQGSGLSKQQSFKQKQARPGLHRTPSTQSVESFQEFQQRKRRWEKFKKVEERPKRGLVVIWLVVLAELSFDLGTTIIAFRAMLQDDDCCGEPLNLGPLPLSVATPFIFLIVLELFILLRAMVLTMWPSILDHQKKQQNEDGKAQTSRCFCNCFRWSVKTLLKVINVLVLLNPFFGCIIAWMLLYQSDKDESFLVLGLEGGSIILHFISVKLEGSVQNFRQFLFHCMPLIPFLASVTLVLVYLKQEGVCYIVAQAVFQFSGCEICPNGFPPINGNCVLENGTIVAINDSGFLDVEDSILNNPGDLTKASANQATFCGKDHIGWDNNTNFCFFGYDGDD